MANLNSFLDFQYMVSSFLRAVKMVDKKIEDSKVQIITKQNQQNGDQLKLNAITQQLNHLNYSHSLLKRGFTRTIMIFSQLLDPQASEDYTHLQLFQDQLHNLLPPREMITDDQVLLLVMHEIKNWITKADIHSEKMKELALRLDTKKRVCFSCEEEVKEWSMTEVLTKIYGFNNLERVKHEEKIIRKLKKEEALCLSTNHRLPAEIIYMIDGNLRENKSNLGEFLQVINKIRNSSEFGVEMEEANHELLQWLYYVEREIFVLVNDLVFIFNKYPMEIITKLQELKKQEQGKVPLVVYRILFLLEEKMVVAEAGAVVLSMNEAEFEYLMLQLFLMILMCSHVMNNIYSSSNNICSQKEVFLESFDLVRRCDEKISGMRVEVDELIRSEFN